MGGLHSGHLDARQRKHLAGYTGAVLKDFAPHYQRQLPVALLEHIQEEVGHRKGCDTRLLHNPDAVSGSDVVLEGNLQVFQDGKWRERHLLVTKEFAVESRDSKEVFEKGWECKTTLILTGSQVSTSVEEHCRLLDTMCQHIKGSQGGKMPFSECPTEFPVFIHHPYLAPLCVATNSKETQLQWQRVLQSVVLHHSTVLQRKGNVETRAFLEAVRFYRQEKGSYATGVLAMGSEEEVLSSVIVEDLLPALRDQLFPRLVHSKSKKGYVWLQLLSQVYSLVLSQVTVELSVLMKEVTQRRPQLERQIRSDLDQISTLQDQIAQSITDEMSLEIEQCVTRLVTPTLNSTYEELATPLHAGLAAIRQLFLDVCGDIICTGCTGQSLQELVSPLCSLGVGSARLSDCLLLLETAAERQKGWQESWGIESCRPLVLQAQSAVQQLLESAVFTFRRLLTLQFSYSLSPAQLSQALQRVHDRVLKQLDHDLVVLQAQLAGDALLHIALPMLLKELVPRCKLHLTKYEQMVFSDYSDFLHIDNMFHSVLKEALTTEIRGVLKDTPKKYKLSLHCPSLALLNTPEQSYSVWPASSRDRSYSQLSGSTTLTSSTSSYENLWTSTEDSTVDNSMTKQADNLKTRAMCHPVHAGNPEFTTNQMCPNQRQWGQNKGRRVAVSNMDSSMQDFTTSGQASRLNGDYISLVGTGKDRHLFPEGKQQ
ncbi:protein Niban 1 [Lepisosteus oculatus]|uniref:protein Niban 1 n=1 Tax=Lepisosteus oculatus TaxID=7918 RepID=UPI0035F52EB4